MLRLKDKNFVAQFLKDSNLVGLSRTGTQISPVCFNKECCLLYILTRVWVLSIQNTGWNTLFHIFCMKNVKRKIEGKLHPKKYFWGLRWSKIPIKIKMTQVCSFSYFFFRQCVFGRISTILISIHLDKLLNLITQLPIILGTKKYNILTFND